MSETGAENSTESVGAEQVCYVPPEFANGLPPPSSVAIVTANIWKIVPPILILLGTFGNALTIVVIIRRRGKMSSTAIFLLVLAFSDTLFLYNAPLRQWIVRVWKYDVRSYNEVGCKVSIYLTYACVQFSSWLLVAVTAERVTSVLWPHRVKLLWTPKVSSIVIAVLFVIIFGLNAHFFHGMGRWVLPGGVYPCEPLYDEYRHFFHKAWSWIDFTVAFVLPFVCLVVGNTIIVYKLWKAQHMREAMSGVDNEERTTSHHVNESRGITVMLVVLSVIFFICLTPVSVYYIYVPYVYAEIGSLQCTDPLEFIRRRDITFLWNVITNCFGFLNASINFMLYVLSGAKFRMEVKSLLCCKWRNNVASYRSNTSATHYRSSSSEDRTRTIAMTSTSGRG